MGVTAVAPSQRPLAHGRPVGSCHASSMVHCMHRTPPSADMRVQKRAPAEAALEGCDGGNRVAKMLATKVLAMALEGAGRIQASELTWWSSRGVVDGAARTVVMLGPSAGVGLQPCMPRGSTDQQLAAGRLPTPLPPPLPARCGAADSQARTRTRVKGRLVRQPRGPSLTAHWAAEGALLLAAPPVAPPVRATHACRATPPHAATPQGRRGWTDVMIATCWAGWRSHKCPC